MKKLLLFIASLGLASELNLNELEYLEYDCYINYINNEFVACGNDIYKNNDKVLSLDDNIIFIDDYDINILAISSKDGLKTLNIYKDNKLLKFKISSDINKAFLYKDKIILTSLGSELIIRDLSFNLIKKVHFSNASINAASINKEKAKIALGFESGKIVVYDLNSNDFISKEVHKDNIYNVDYKKDNIISCSTDRKVIINDDKLNEITNIESDNLVYNCALSDNLNFAYSCDLENNICIGKDKINIGNLYLNSILFDKNTLKLNAYSKILYKKDF
ncbi:hypothetical protein [Campylobacter sp. MG1]|uniref:hypothetical protein n=1 Tax=Campylobacter sp. MG1 TaxID=2976332 RepID=UPI00226D335B|nr:hypothetical protein [Campylobacter sp. MG1]